MGNEMEANPERLRRPDADEDQLIMKPPLTPLAGQTRAGSWRADIPDVSMFIPGLSQVSGWP